MLELQLKFDQFHDNKPLSRLYENSPPRAATLPDVKDQTEYFMEKGEIRKYIPFFVFLKIVQFGKCLFFCFYSSRSDI